MSKRKARPTRTDSKPARTDSWANIGARRSPSKIHDFQPMHGYEVLPDVAATLFRTDDMARRAIRAIVDDAMREGFTFVDEGDGAEPLDAKQLNEACRKWEVTDRITEADIWGRAFGGGFIMLGVKGAGEQFDVLDDNKIRRNGLLFLDVYDRRDVVPLDYYTDPLSPKHGQVQRWTLQPSGAYGSSTAAIHETRMIRFGGTLTARRERAQNGCWDDSVYNAIFSVLQSSALNWKSICALMADFAQGVFKIKDLVKIIAQNEEGVIQTRMRLIDQNRSTERAILLDADKEDFERKASPVAGAAELMDRTWQRVAAAFEMPVTRLMGMSPAGLNATGESDTINWHNSVGAHRSKVIAPRLERLGRIIARSEGIAEPKSLSIQFPSLWQTTPTQEADIRLKTAQTMALLVEKSIVMPSEAAMSMFGKGKFSTEITIDAKARIAMLAKELIAALENAGKIQQPPPPKPPLPLNAHALGEPSETPPSGA